ncbi:hypothetical protein PGT21_036365 [Puccinia graminis f. sp. tritici]|uniref:Oligopeptide transporter n=1 Tax=Puccinia graminis f. sp. tritici TaxID=56615 RepID=A0A5B0P0V6_PUCGR|nr:hypothetical protein PGT21_036365 [Puccinia graminis f. sp. tritici]
MDRQGAGPWKPPTISDDSMEKAQAVASARRPSNVSFRSHHGAGCNASLSIEVASNAGRDHYVPPASPVKLAEADKGSKDSCLGEKTETISLYEDSEPPIMTVRSVSVGIFLAVFGVSVTQLFLFKPVHMNIKLMFLQIAAVILGRGCALIPGPKWWNPGPYTLKETGFCALMGTTASIAVLATEMIVVYDLYFDHVINFGIAFCILISSQLIGFAWAGVLLPILVYPTHAVFPETLPSISLLKSLFSVGEDSKDQVKFFKKAFLTVIVYEIFPTYITPALQAVNVFCLTLPKDPIVTSIFGGAQPFQGMGIFSVSGDWSMVGGLGPLYMPLTTQMHQLAAWVVSTLVFFLVYTKSWFGSGYNQHFPFLSVGLFTSEGKPYPYRQAVNQDGTANEDYLEKSGLPFFTGTYYIVQILLTTSLTSSIAHAVLYNYRIFGAMFKKSKRSADIDPHRLVCQKYKDFPLWGFILLALGAIGLAFGMSAISNSGLSAPALIVALIVSFILTLGTGFIFALTGFVVRLSPGIQMLGGLLFPGNVFASMWFTVYGGTSAYQGLNILKNMKYGQYIHLPPRLVVYSQLIGCTVGSLTTLLVARAIVSHEREVLLSPHGNGIFSGAEIAAFQARAVSWGLFSRHLFLSGQRYSAVSWGMLIGFALPVPFFVAHKIWPRFKLNQVIVPLFLGIVPGLYNMAYAGELARMVIGLASQLWARRYRAQWFNKYNYILSAALDGGTEVAVFVLAMAFQGGGGRQIKFPTYFLNPPSSTPRDYCWVDPNSRAG